VTLFHDVPTTIIEAERFLMDLNKHQSVSVDVMKGR